MHEIYDRTVHVDAETHTAAVAFCREHNLIAAHWVSALILDAAKRAIRPPPHNEARLRRYVRDLYAQPSADEHFETLLSAWGEGVRK